MNLTLLTYARLELFNRRLHEYRKMLEIQTGLNYKKVAQCIAENFPEIC